MFHIAPVPNCRRVLDWLEKRSRPSLVALTLASLVLVGALDYLTGFEFSFLTCYLLPVALAAWFLGRPFAIGTAILSVIAIWLAGDFTGGAVSIDRFILGWNVAIDLAFFLIVIWLLHHLRLQLRDLELRVEQRTSALGQQIHERQRLEREILEISEREQRRIGHDLHDGLGQHLTGTALAGQVLADRLCDMSQPEAFEAARLVSLIEEAIELTRSLARGLSPVALEDDGLMMACCELAARTSERFHLDCHFSCETAVPLGDPIAAAHLYRIAQEATNNAVRHAGARHIGIALARQRDEVMLSVEDDGVGLSEAALRGCQRGLGLRIMAHRASMIGAKFAARRGATRGTFVQCCLPPTRLMPPGNAEGGPASSSTDRNPSHIVLKTSCVPS
jgi:signal transduction histidine kinase